MAAERELARRAWRVDRGRGVVGVVGEGVVLVARERRVKDWMEGKGRMWKVEVEVERARRLVTGQAVKRVPSRVGVEGRLVVRRMLGWGKEMLA